MPRRLLHPPERVAEYTARGWWSPDTMDPLFRAQVARQPDRVAVVDPANKAALVGTEPRRLTWRELDVEVDRLAVVLRDRGAEAGDVLAVQLPNTVELVVAYLAAWRLGLIVTPFPVQFREHEIVELAGLADASLFLTSVRIGDRSVAADIAGYSMPSVRAVLAFGPSVPSGVLSADSLMSAVTSTVDARAADPNECVTICWTSGTESTPKGVPRCHYDWLAICWGTVDAPRLTEHDVLLNPFPMVNMAGINGMFLPWLRVGCVLVQHHPFDLSTFLTQIGAEGVTYTVAPPALLTLLLQRPEMLAAADISTLKQIGSGSVPLQPPMVRGWQERGIGIINFFGSNEGIALLTDPHDVPDPAERARYFPRYGVAGHTWSSRIAEWTSVRLVDPVTAAEVDEPGVPGELRIKGPTVFAGYLNGDRLPSPFDEQGYLRTGDVFVIAGEDRQFLEYVDRAKDLVIRGGMNIAPAELEGLIAAHPAVADVAIVGYPDDVLGEKVCAVVVPREGASIGLEDLVGFLREKRIASYKLPEHLRVRDSLPRNPVGKILKRELRDEIAKETS